MDEKKNSYSWNGKQIIHFVFYSKKKKQISSKQTNLSAKRNDTRTSETISTLPLSNSSSKNKHTYTKQYCCAHRINSTIKMNLLFAKFRHIGHHRTEFQHYNLFGSFYYYHFYFVHTLIWMSELKQILFILIQLKKKTPKFVLFWNTWHMTDYN